MSSQWAEVFVCRELPGFRLVTHRTIRFPNSSGRVSRTGIFEVLKFLLMMLPYQEQTALSYLIRPARPENGSIRLIGPIEFAPNKNPLSVAEFPTGSY